MEPGRAPARAGAPGNSNGGGETRRRSSQSARNTDPGARRGVGTDAARYPVGTDRRSGGTRAGRDEGRGIPLTTERARDPGASPPPPGTEPGDPSRPAPGVIEELKRVRDRALALLRAHVALLKAEIGEIAADLKVIAALGGVILAIALFAAQLLAIGGTLFLGEWLFGSIGWGVLDGLLLALAIIVAAAMTLVAAPRRVIGVPFVLAVIVWIVVAVVLGSNVGRRTAADAATRWFPGLDHAWAPDILGVVVVAIVLALVLLVALGRVGGPGGAVAGLVLGAIAGAFAGWGWTGITFSWHGAAALGLTIGLLAWIALMPAWMLRAHVDPTARFRRLWPRRSYESAMETKDWLEAEWQRRRARLGSR